VPPLRTAVAFEFFKPLHESEEIEHIGYDPDFRTQSCEDSQRQGDLNDGNGRWQLIVSRYTFGE